MKTISLILSLALVAALAHGESRSFTQKDTGKTLSGELKAVHPQAGTVTIAVDGGKPVTFKQSILSDEDQEYIREWAEANAVSANVRLTAVKVTGERTTVDGGVYQTKKQQNGFKVTVRNSSSTAAISDLTVNYTLVVQRGGGKIETVKGSHVVTYLAVGGYAEFSTDMVELAVAKKSLSSCPKCVDAAGEFEADNLEGIYLTVEKDGKSGAEAVIPGNRERVIREAVGAAK